MGIKLTKKCECGTKIQTHRANCGSLFCKLFPRFGYYENGKRKLNEKGLELHKIGYKNLRPRHNKKQQLIFILDDLHKNKITTKKAIAIIKKM